MGVLRWRRRWQAGPQPCPLACKPTPQPTRPYFSQEAYQRLDAREARARQAESELADARAAAQADLQAAELAKRGLESERSELAALRDQLRQQQAAAAAEAARLAELQQREAQLKQREAELEAAEQRLGAQQTALGEAERRVRAGADSVAEGLVVQARAEADAILQAARDECRRAEEELKALREQLAAADGDVRRRELAADAAANEARSAADAAAAERRRAAEASSLIAEKEALLRQRWAGDWSGKGTDACIGGMLWHAPVLCAPPPSPCKLPCRCIQTLQGGAAGGQGA